jgi:hypothetical protein
MPWELTGNGNIGAAAFLGTTDHEALVIKTDNKPALIVDTAGNVGIGTPVPVSVLEAKVSATRTLGPSLTLTNPGGGLNAAAAIDFNTFSSTSGTYNPSSRIEGVDDGNFANDIVFLSNTPGAPNNGLVEIMRMTSGVATGTLGPSLTLTNHGGGRNAAASLDFNTFSPSTSGTYNPSSRIKGVDDGNFANDIVFLSNRPGAPNNGLVEIMRITPHGMNVNLNLGAGGAGDAVVGISGSGRGLVGNQQCPGRSRRRQSSV